MSDRVLTTIAVGDTVVINNRRTRSLHTVTKITATQFAIDNGTRFMKSCGRQYGGGAWDSSWASIASDADIAAIKAEQRQQQAVNHSLALTRQINDALSVLTGRRATGWALSIEEANEHMRRALEALQTKQGSLL